MGISNRLKTDTFSQVIIVSTAIIIFFTVLAFGSNKYLVKNNRDVIISEIAVHTPDPVASPVDSSPESIKKENILATYRNEEYGYKLKYPDTWIVYSDNAADIFIQPKPDEVSDLPVPHEGALEIKVKPAASGAVLSKIANKEKEDGISSEEKTIKIGGVEGIKTDTAICQAIGCEIFEWFVIKNDHLYHLSTIYPDMAYNKDFDQIISTISFFDSTE